MVFPFARFPLEFAFFTSVVDAAVVVFVTFVVFVIVVLEIEFDRGIVLIFALGVVLEVVFAFINDAFV